MMNTNRITLEHALFILVFVVALFLRVLNLGAVPLSDQEANLALQAYDVSHGKSVDLDSNPGYVALTAVTFFLFGSSNFLARFWPALAGSLVILAVYLLRRQLGSLAALILMLGIALDAGMVAMSRQAGGSMLAMGFGLVALALVLNHRPALAGVAVGLSLLGGPSFLHGVIGLFLAWGVWQLMGAAGRSATERLQPNAILSREWRIGLLTAALTLLGVGTLFLYMPQGLAALVSGLPVYLSGWVTYLGVPALRLLGALLVYQPFALIFGLLGGVRGWQHGNRLAAFLSLWFAFSLGVVLLYPGRQVGDLIWCIPPLWGLASIELAGYLGDRDGQTWVRLALAGLIFLLMALFWLNLASVDQPLSLATGGAVRLGVLFGLLALGAVATMMVALGWSWPLARQGMVWGVCLGLGIYITSMTWSATQLNFPGHYELWQPTPATQNDDLLLGTLGDHSEWHTGLRQTVDVVLVAPPESLRWALRLYPRLTVVEAESSATIPDNAASVVIARKTEEPLTLARDYRGQDIDWLAYPAWQTVMPPNFARWLTTHQAPLTHEAVILWARSDLFPGEVGSLPGTAPLENNPPK